MRPAIFYSYSGCSFGDIVSPITGLDEHGDLLSGADLVRVKRGPEKVAVFFLLRFSFLFESQKCLGAVLPQQKTVGLLVEFCFDLRDVSRIRTAGVKFKKGVITKGAIIPKCGLIQHVIKKIRVRGIERIAGLARRCRSAPCEHHTVGLIIGDLAASARLRITLPVIRVTVAFGMDDAADVHGVRRLPPGPVSYTHLDHGRNAGRPASGL